jgi:hypothetical protein
VTDVNEIEITPAKYENATKDIFENSIYFKDEEKYRGLFFKSKRKDDGIISKLCKINTLISLLDSYNIELRNGKRVKKNGKLKYEHSLAVNEQLMNMIKIKYNL